MEVTGQTLEQEARRRWDFDVEVSRPVFSYYQRIILPLHEDWRGRGERRMEQDYSLSCFTSFKGELTSKVKLKIYSCLLNRIRDAG